VKLASNDVAAPSTPVRTESVKIAKASSPLPVRAETDRPSPSRASPVANLPGRSNSSANDVINDRGYWQGLPGEDTADAGQTTVVRSSAPVRRAAEKVATASVAPWPINDRTNDRGPSVGALGYAPQATSGVARAVPSSAGNSRVAAVSPEAAFASARADEPALLSPAERKGPDVVQVGDRFNDPWMRAMMVSPSAQRYMKTTLYGSQDFRSLGPLLAKPDSAVAVKFVDDPTHGMSTERFGGGSVAFIPIVKFVPRTASLR
jgi:hypothetical protein